MATRASRNDGPLGSLSPQERSALRRRWHQVIPLALAVLLLASLVLVLHAVERRTRTKLDESAELVDPARMAVTTIELALALERSGASGYLLTGDPVLSTDHAEAELVRTQAQAELLPLARQLGPRIEGSARTLVDHLTTVDATWDSLYEGRLSRAAYTARWRDEHARFATIVAEAAGLQFALRMEAGARRRAIIVAQRWAAILSTALAIGACGALGLLAHLGLGFQSFAIRLDAREQQQSALRETARALNASISVADAARIIADGVLVANSATAAIVELAREPGDDSPMAVGMAARGVPSRSANVSYEKSLTGGLDGSGAATVITPAEPLLDRMNAPASVPRTGLRGMVFPIISDGYARGMLAVVRSKAPAQMSEVENSYFGALVELASSMLGRVELVGQLRASEERFRQVADNIRGFVWLRDPHSAKFLYANAAYEEIWGRSRESLFADGNSWLDATYPDDRARVDAVMGRWPPDPYDLEYRIVRPDGEIRWVWARGFPVRDEAGEIYRTTGANEDVTERKQNELAREELVERERTAREASEAAHAAAERRREELERVTESRSRLLRGFTHDVKNPLGAADGFLALLDEGVFGTLTGKQLEGVARARGSIHRALELITGILELARADAADIKLQHVVVNVGETIREVVREYQAQAEAKRQEMSTEIGPDVPAITSDPARIRQVVGNLLSNAIKYTPADGRIAIRVSGADGRAPDTGKWVVIDVSDNGPGIPPNQLQKVFDEFTRLHPQLAAGAGVGLAISQRLARALGGKLTVESREGEGSRFSLWLPRSERREQPRRESVPPPKAA